jgi:hypothetical protein
MGQHIGRRARIDDHRDMRAATTEAEQRAGISGRLLDCRMAKYHNNAPGALASVCRASRAGLRPIIRRAGSRGAGYDAAERNVARR